MGRLLAAVAAEQNVLEAWQRTLDRLPAEPILIPEVENFRADLLRNLTEISTALRSAEWTPKSLRTTTIAKADGTRTLRIPSVADRVAERAIATVLTRSVDHLLQPDSYAFRPGVGVEDARRALQARIDAGNRWVVRTDIADCFDSLSRRGCTRAVAEMIDDPDLMTIITRCIDRSDSSCSPIGIAQGSPLSPRDLEHLPRRIRSRTLDQRRRHSPIRRRHRLRRRNPRTRTGKPRLDQVRRRL